MKNLYKIHFINIRTENKSVFKLFPVCRNSDHLMVTLYIELMGFHLSLCLKGKLNLAMVLDDGTIITKCVLRINRASRNCVGLPARKPS